VWLTRSQACTKALRLLISTLLCAKKSGMSIICRFVRTVFLPPGRMQASRKKCYDIAYFGSSTGPETRYVLMTDVVHAATNCAKLPGSKSITQLHVIKRIRI
jgi:hypothetical protein